MSEFTQFDYLLNAMLEAAREAYPSKAGYAGKRKALFDYVRELERRPAPPAAKAVEMDANKLRAAIMNLPCKAPPVFSLSAYEQSIYAIGHKDARHAAAKLILAALSKQGGNHG